LNNEKEPSNRTWVVRWLPLTLLNTIEFFPVCLTNALISILFCVAQQIQESECRDTKHIFTRLGIMHPEVRSTLGHNDSSGRFGTQFRNGIIVGNRRTFPVLYPENSRNFNQALRGFATVARKRPKGGGGATTLLLGYRIRSTEFLSA